MVFTVVFVLLLIRLFARCMKNGKIKNKECIDYDKSKNA